MNKMVNTLHFAADDVRRVVNHAISAKDWSKSYFDKSRRKPHPQIILVHDLGVYLMSNGKPRDIIKDEWSFCAYARGFDPFKDKGWQDAAHTVVGGDDFAVYFDLSAVMVANIQSANFRGLAVDVIGTNFAIRLLQMA